MLLKIRVYVMKHGGGCCCGNLRAIPDGCDVRGQPKGVISFTDGSVCCAGTVVGSIEEELVWLLNPLWVTLCGSVALLTSCFLGRSSRRPPGYEDTSILANETVCMSSSPSSLYLHFYVSPFTSLT